MDIIEYTLDGVTYKLQKNAIGIWSLSRLGTDTSSEVTVTYEDGNLTLTGVSANISNDSLTIEGLTVTSFSDGVLEVTGTNAINDSHVAIEIYIPKDEKGNYKPSSAEGLNDAIRLLASGGTLEGDKMKDYYPEFIKQIQDIMAVTYAVGVELDHLRAREVELTNNGFLYFMDESRTAEWEKYLGMSYSESDTLDERRKAVIARIRAKNKLNTETIKSIVTTFTGGTATVKLENGVLTVNIKPPANGVEFNLDTVTRELQAKVPAHMMLVVNRDYSTWAQIKSDFASWNEVSTSFARWQDVNDYIAQGG